MQRLTRLAASVGCVAVLSGCATSLVNFDQLPNGSPVTAQTAPVLVGNPIDPNSIISNQYASKGFTFSSGSNGVFAANFGQHNPPSAPNVACPTGPGDTADFSHPTEIKIGPRTCNIWVTITESSGIATMSAFDANGNALGTPASSHGSAPGRPGVTETLHINACGIDKVQLAGINYCFDNVKIRCDNSLSCP
ncbi:MAG: hypothetical protein HYT88_03140 [Candidatus Omnitrophica bacterium]|nr:hypothetical protein [Candidatus Omnitrophota bacterium]